MWETVPQCIGAARVADRSTSAHFTAPKERQRQAGGWRLARQSVAHHRTYRANMGLELNQMFDIDKQKAVLFRVFTIHFVSPKGIMPLNYCHSLLTILTIHSTFCNRREKNLLLP